MSFEKKKQIILYRRNNPVKNKKKSKQVNYKYHMHFIYPLIFSVLVTACITLYLCQCAKLISVQYRIGELKTQRQRLENEKRRVKLNIERLEALERIENIACNRLKMKSPDRRMVLDLIQPTNTAQYEDSELLSASP